MKVKTTQKISKGYKQTEIGVIPEDWELKSIEKMSIPNGLVRGPFGGALKKEFFVPKGYKVYEQRNAIYCDVTLGTYYINISKFEELRRFEVKKGDFIISCSGTIGKIYQIPENFRKGVINQALLKITINNNLFSDQYFNHYFKWEKFQQRIIDNTQGGAMKNLIGMVEFRKTLVTLPPTKSEQTAIATVLSDTDALIEHLEKLIAKKKTIKQGAMQQLLTGKKRLPGFSGNKMVSNRIIKKDYKQTDIGVIPSDWVLKKLANVASLKARIGWQGLTTAEYKDSGEYYLITGTDFKNGFIDWENCHYVEKARYNQDKNIQIKEHDVLVTKDGTIGKVALINRISKPTTLNSGVFVIRPFKNEFFPEYFYYLLLSEVFYKFLVQLSAGSTINHLYQKDFVNFLFQAPSNITEQSAIAAILSDMDSEIEKLEQKRDKYIMLKQGMMQKLLTGRIRIYANN